MTSLKIICSSLFALNIFFSGIGDYTVPKIEGGEQALNIYAGKNVLIVCLPVIQDSTGMAMLISIDSLASANASTLKIIGVPSIEDGFFANDRPALLLWYRSKLGENILISDGLYTRKASGSSQHALFQWLTQVEKNQVFNIDSGGPGQKFFVNEAGTLYAVLSALTPFNSRVINNVLNVQ